MWPIRRQHQTQCDRRAWPVAWHNLPSSWAALHT